MRSVAESGHREKVDGWTILRTEVGGLWENVDVEAMWLVEGQEEDGPSV